VNHYTYNGTIQILFNINMYKEYVYNGQRYHKRARGAETSDGTFGKRTS